MIKYFFILLLLPQALLAAPQQDDDVAENSTDWRGLVNLARKAYQQKDYQKAMLFYQTAIPVLPENIDIADEMAQTQYRLKQYQAAEEIYNKRTQGKANEKARSYHNLGNISMQNKDYKKAIEQYKNALRNNPTNEKTRYNLSEAIRRQKEDEKKNPPPPKDKDDQKDKKDDPKDKDKDKKDPKKDKDKDPSDGKDSPSALSDNSIERELDKLMRKEAKTKRKVASSKEGEGGQISKKAW